MKLERATDRSAQREKRMPPTSDSRRHKQAEEMHIQPTSVFPTCRLTSHKNICATNRIKPCRLIVLIAMESATAIFTPVSPRPGIGRIATAIQ